MRNLKSFFIIDHNAPSPSLAAIVLMGIAQIFVWGGSFFLLTVLARPIMAETGWSRQWVYGALSLSIFISGILLPYLGKHIAYHGGRNILAYSGIVTAIGLIIIGFSSTLPIFLMAWCVLGIAMAMGLYDALYATLGNIYGSHARKSIVTITLISGFCTSIVWPLLAFGVSHIGWRNTCFIWAGLLIVIILPIYWLSLPKAIKTPPPKNKELKQAITIDKTIYHLMANIFMLAAIIMAAITVQLIDLLQEEGFKLTTAIAISTLIGPVQVLVRVIDLLVKIRHPVWSLLLSILLVFIGVSLIYLSPQYAAIAVILYAAGNGLRSIVRGALPLTIVKPEEFAFVMGKIARPSLIGQALTPFLFGTLLEQAGAKAVLAALVIIAMISLLLTALLILKLKQKKYLD